MGRSWLLGLFLIGLTIYCSLSVYFGHWSGGHLAENETGSEPAVALATGEPLEFAVPVRDEVPEWIRPTGGRPADMEPLDPPVPESASQGSGSEPQADPAREAQAEAALAPEATLETERSQAQPGEPENESAEWPAPSAGGEGNLAAGEAAGDLMNDTPGGALEETPEAQRARALSSLAKADQVTNPVERARLLTQAMRSFALDRQEAQEVYQALLATNARGILNPRVLEGFSREAVQPGDSLWKIVRRVEAGGRPRVSTGLLQLVNGLASDRIRVGQKLKIPNQAPVILISKRHYQLDLMMGDVLIARMPVGHGRENRTPVGDFEIASREKEPTWYPESGGSVAFGDEENPLGTRWLGFKSKPDLPSASSFGIHGTSDESSIGGNQSEGCVRMKNADVEWLFELVDNGTQVSIVP